MKTKQVDDGSESVALCITHTPVQTDQIGIAEPRDGSSEDWQQCYVLFPLDCGEGGGDRKSRYDSHKLLC